jgi:hypothetical protein
MNIIDMIVKDMVDQAFEDWATPKYLYRARTPLGRFIEVEGKGDEVKWPEKLVKKLWFWRLLGKIFKNSFWIYIDRKEINRYKDSNRKTNWQQCFWWPVSKL